MSELKFNENYLGKAELDRFQEFITKEGYDKKFLANVVKFGFVNGEIVTKEETLNSFNNARVIDGGENSQGNREVVVSPLFLIDRDGLNIVKNSTNLVVPDNNEWHWLYCEHRYSDEEQGVFEIDDKGNLSGLGGNLTSVLRGQPDFPSKVKFKNASSNTLEYEVVQVIDDNNAILAGDFTAEDNLKLSVVGTFASDYIPEEFEKFIFQYDSANLFLLEETVENTPEPYIENKQFTIARVKNDGSEILVQDKRTDWLKTKSEYMSNSAYTKPNPLIGVENVKYNNNFSTRDRNIASLSFGFRSTNYSVNSSLNRITINSGRGGVFKNTEYFSDGDFDGWRVYSLDLPNENSYFTVKSSTRDGSEINLKLSNLDNDVLSSDNGATFSSEILIVPPVTAIEFTFYNPDDSTLYKRETFPIATASPKVELINKDIQTFYIVKYRYIRGENYSPQYELPNSFYLTENSFNNDGSLKPESDRVLYDYFDSTIRMIRASNSYFNRIENVDTGERLGVRTFSLSNAAPVQTFRVGETKKISVIRSSFNFTVDHFFNISTENAVSGNEFEIILKSRINLNGNSLKIVQGYESTGSIGQVILDIDDRKLSKIYNGNKYSVRLIYDGNNWISKESFESVLGDSYVELTDQDEFTFGNESGTLASSAVVNRVSFRYRIEDKTLFYRLVANVGLDNSHTYATFLQYKINVLEEFGLKIKPCLSTTSTMGLADNNDFIEEGSFVPVFFEYLYQTPMMNGAKFNGVSFEMNNDFILIYPISSPQPSIYNPNPSLSPPLQNKSFSNISYILNYLIDTGYQTVELEEI